MDQKKLLKKAIESYGLTDDCLKGGFILSNGEMLDFTDPEDTFRKKEHVYIEKILPHVQSQCDYYRFPPIYEFMKNTNSVRLNTASEIAIQMTNHNKLTRKQKETIEYCSLMLQKPILIEQTECEGKTIKRTELKIS